MLRKYFFHREGQLPFHLITLSAFILCLLIQLVQEGAFHDGLLYTSVARNMAEGNGTFWEPRFAHSLHAAFHEQPPMGIFLLSCFFRLFGDHIYTEHFFFLLLALLSTWLITRCWKLIYEGSSAASSLAWLPVLFWIITPMVFYAFANNLLEPVMGFFDLAAIFALLKAFAQRQRIVPWLLLASFCTLMAALCKGPQGLFPLAGILFYRLAFRDISWRQTISYSFVLLIVPLCATVYFMSEPAASNSFAQYYHQRIQNTFQNENAATTASHFYLLERLLVETAPLTLLCLLLVLVQNLRGKAVEWEGKEHGLFFLLIGLAGSLPLMVTREQRFFYLSTSMPFFVIGFSTMLSGFSGRLMNYFVLHRRSFSLLRITSIVLLVLSIGFGLSKAGDTRRDKDLISDIKKLRQIIPVQSVAGCDENLRKDWGLHAYLMRYAHISLEKAETGQDFFLAPKGERSPGAEFSKLYLQTKMMDVYVKNSTQPLSVSPLSPSEQGRGRTD